MVIAIGIWVKSSWDGHRILYYIMGENSSCAAAEKKASMF